MILSIECDKSSKTKILQELHRNHIYGDYQIFNSLSTIILLKVKAFDCSDTCLLIDTSDKPTIEIRDINIRSIHGRGEK